MMMTKPTGYKNCINLKEKESKKKVFRKKVFFLHLDMVALNGMKGGYTAEVSYPSHCE